MSLILPKHLYGVTPELEEEGMESFLRRIAAEYVQTRQDSAPRKKSGF